MRSLNKFNILILVFTCSLFFLFGTNAFSLTSNVFPDHISVHSLYRGSKVVITGDTEAGNEIIIKISSPGVKAHLRKKGKAGGVLWMNIGELEFNPVSEVYLIYTTHDINKILSKSQQDKYAIGYDAVSRFVKVSPADDEAEKERWIKEFIKFKEKNKIYGVFPGKIEAKTTKNKKTYTLTLDWPYKASPQEYMVSIYAVKDNVIQEKTESPLVVEKVGALIFLSSMAFNNAAIYGIISIIIAIAAGFLVSLIFKGGGRSH